MASYKIPVPYGRGFRGGDPPSPQQIAKATRVADLILHSLIGRVAANDNSSYEFDVRYDEKSGKLDLNIPDEYLNIISQVDKGERLNSYIAWLISGTGATTEFKYSQPVDSATWTIVHDLGRNPATVSTHDQFDNTIFGDVSYPDINTVVITYSSAIAGHALLIF